ncbi:MAG: ROK family protein [Phycicoccus sp.]
MRRTWLPGRVGERASGGSCPDRAGHTGGVGPEVGDLVAQGNPDAARLTQDAGRLVGEVLATAVSVLNPEVVLLGGALASAPLLAGVRETLYSLALPRATRHVVLQLGSLGEDAATAGLTRLVVDHEYSAAAIDRRLRA